MAGKEIPKEIADKVFEIIELARSSGKISKGANEVTKILERNQAKLVVIAKDTTPPEIIMHIPLIAKEKEVPCVEVPSKKELGTAAGINVPTSAVAVINEGEAKKIIEELKK